MAPGYSGTGGHCADYFECFNRGDYYLAHDILEAVWLKEGKSSPDYAFYKGLIQGAGAFVHLKKHHEHPGHRVHARRLEPAARLLALGLKNLSGYGDLHNKVDLIKVRAVFRGALNALEASGCRTSPWTPETAPRITM